MKKTKRRSRTQRQEGSALLVSLMVMVGLSLLGLGFVAISETESAISVNERNSVEVLSRAEAGARVVVEWFQDPDWAELQGLMPPNDGTYPNILTQRNPAGQNYGWYKTSGDPSSGGVPTGKFCDKPYKPAAVDRFWGDERQSDVIINDTTAVDGGVTFLSGFNNLLFGTDLAGGQITEIRIFAPPVIGGVLTARSGQTVAANGGFYVGGVRYGLATIKVTARKFRGTQVVAERSVTMVISEWPFPGPQGPVQSNASIDTGGNFGVHWGRITAMETLEDSRAVTSLPWHNAWDRINFEHDWDSSIEWKSGLVLNAGDYVHPSQAAITAAMSGATYTLEKFAYRVDVGGTTGATEPTWPTSTAAGSNTVSEGAIQYTCVPSREWPRTHAPSQSGIYRFDQSPPGVSPQNLHQYNYLKEVVGKSFEDLWFEARARDAITIPSSPDTPQLYPYTGPTQDEVANEKSLFENQNRSDTATHLYRQVTFPRIDYDFWKDVAIQASATGEERTKYLRWVDTDRYTDGITTQKFVNWVNTDPNLANPASSGFYFFDSKNGMNPQNGATANLTPELKLNASDANPLQMQGFIYLNSIRFNSTGVNGIEDYYGYPGEPYRDIGYRKVNSAGTAWELDGDGNYIIDDMLVGNSLWDYQDVNGNHEFDLVLVPKTFTIDTTTPSTCTNCLVPKRWYPGCTVGTNCSEPHEPYLNVQYPPESTVVVGGAAPPAVTISWGTSASAHITRAKEKMPDGSLPNCASNPEKCTSAKYDRDGGLIRLSPIMVGVLYNEGEYAGTGNAVYYGSLLINGAVGKAGTADVYFDESLIKGNWSERFQDFPRVLITAHETDRQ